MTGEEHNEGAPAPTTGAFSRELYPALIDAVPDALVVVDVDGRIVLVNGETQRLFGYAEVELLGATVELLIPERFRARHATLRGTYSAAPRFRPMGSGDLRALRKDGSEFDADVSLSPILLGRHLFVAAAVRDVSERALSDKRLRDSEQNFRLLVENVPELIVVHRDLSFLYVNPAAAAFFGAESGSELVGTSLRRFVLPEDASNYDPRLREVLRENRAVPQREMPCRRMDGTVATLEVVSLPVLYAGQRSVLTFGRDITERKRSEAVRIHLANVVDSSHDAIYSKSLDGTIQSWNRGAERMFGYTESEIVGGNVSLLALPGQVDELPDVLAKDSRGEPLEPIETVRRRKDGSVVEVALSISVMREETGNITGASVVARDISTAKEAERKIVESLQEKELLLKEIHHRVKNNLQVIASLLNLQSRKVTDAASLQAIQESRRRVQAIALFHEKLYRSKDLGGVDGAENVRDLVAGVFRAFSLDGGPSFEVEGDPLRLSVDLAVPCGLIVNELVSNAIKHAFPNGRGGNVRVELRAVGEHEAKLIVADDGVGLPPDLEARRRRSLGLELVATLCEQIGGKLDAVSDSGGTRFEMRFPLPSKGKPSWRT